MVTGSTLYTCLGAALSLAKDFHQEKQTLDQEKGNLNTYEIVADQTKDSHQDCEGFK